MLDSNIVLIIMNFNPVSDQMSGSPEKLPTKFRVFKKKETIARKVTIGTPSRQE